jgi:hypothetical protein
MTPEEIQFRDELVNESRALAAAETGFTDQAFAKLAGDRLVIAEELGAFEPCYVRHTGPRNAKLKLDGFEWDEDDDSFRLVVSDYEGATEPTRIAKSDVESEFKAVRAFVEQSVSGWCKDNLAPSSEGFRLAEDIRRKVKDSGISRFRVYLVTDGLLSERVKDWPEGTIAGVPIDYRIWDIRRFLEVAQSALGREAIEVDFTNHPGGGVPILRVETDTTNYTGYLGQISGAALADIYDHYGSRLLEGNVRAFLSARGKVNKGIQTTIVKQPEMFFAFNNGIATTASSVSVKITPQGGLILTGATNLQIVNGGQTTASLAFARRKSGVSLDAITVAMKLSEVSEARAAEITPLISRYANSQNKVSDADLWSNHPFHRRLEELSRITLAPATGGLQYGTRWYYERARGQYQSDIARATTPATKRKFENEHPKTQIISKELLAKMENAWRQQPFIVCMGGQKNFLRFANAAANEWEKNDALINEVYFRRLVCKILMHRMAEITAVEVNAEHRAIKAHLANYALATISWLMDQNKRDVDWDQIWREQAIPKDWRELLKLIIERIAPIMTNTDTESTILTEWFKKEPLWQRICIALRDFRLSPELQTISLDESVAALREGRQGQRTFDSLAQLRSVINIGTAGWSELLAWLRLNRVVSDQDVRLVDKFASRPGTVPSEVEARKLMGALAVALNNGFEPQVAATISATDET